MTPAAMRAAFTYSATTTARPERRRFWRGWRDRRGMIMGCLFAGGRRRIGSGRAEGGVGRWEAESCGQITQPAQALRRPDDKQPGRGPQSNLLLTTARGASISYREPHKVLQD